MAFIGEYGNPDDVLWTLEELDFRPFDIELNGVGGGELFWVAEEFYHGTGLSDDKILRHYLDDRLYRIWKGENL